MSEIYWRGFVPLDDKKRSMMAFKDVPDDELLTRKSAGRFDSYAGVLKEGIVLLDFDDDKQAEKALSIVKANNLSCQVIKTTRGCHLLFRSGDHYPKNTVGQRLACGLRCDIKCGDRNAYEVLKLKKEVREIVSECDDPQIAPAYFYPLDSETELYGLKEGDGRNETLFGYLMTLTNHGFTKEETEECAHIINQFVFDSPMDEREFSTVTREEAFDLKVPTFRDKKGRFQHNVFADWLLEHERIIKVNGRLHIYKDGIYVPGEEDIERAMINYVPDIPMSKRKEVFEYIVLRVDHELELADARYIAFKNCIYDIVNDTTMDFSPEIIVTSRIPHNFNPGAMDKIVVNTLMKMCCQDKSKFNLLTEIIGYLFWRRNELGASFFLLGSGSNGKSTFISMLRYLLGTQNMSALSLEDLNKEFRVADLYGKLANLGDDIEYSFIGDTSTFKKVATGNYMTVSPKYEKVFTFAPTAKLIFSANDMPKFRDGTRAALRRIVPIQFKATFSKTDADYDPYIIYKLNTESGASTMINLGIKGLKHVLERNDFTHYDGMKEQLKAIDEANNPISVWVKNNKDKIANNSTQGLYKSYTIWCAECNINPLSKPSWMSQMTNEYGWKVTVMKTPKGDIETFIE